MLCLKGASTLSSGSAVHHRQSGINRRYRFERGARFRLGAPQGNFNLNSPLVFSSVTGKLTVLEPSVAVIT